MLKRTECAGWTIEGDTLTAPDGKQCTVEDVDDSTLYWLGLEVQHQRLTAVFVRRFNIWGRGEVGLFAPHLEATGSG